VKIPMQKYRNGKKKKKNSQIQVTNDSGVNNIPEEELKRMFIIMINKFKEDMNKHLSKFKENTNRTAEQNKEDNSEYERGIK
jgi:hypothetical protein